MGNATGFGKRGYNLSEEPHWGYPQQKTEGIWSGILVVNNEGCANPREGK